jgi:hypothetical protein
LPSADHVASFSSAGVFAIAGVTRLPLPESASTTLPFVSKAMSGKPTETSSLTFVPSATFVPTGGSVPKTVPASASLICFSVSPGTSLAFVSALP